MATIKKRTDKNGKIRYQAIIRLKGTPTQTATFSKITKAKEWIQQIESAIRECRHFKTSESKKHTLAEMIDRYIEQFNISKTKLQHLNWWKSKIGSLTLANIAPSHIAKCRDELLKEKTKREKLRSPSTVIRYLSSLSHVFTMGIKEYGWINDSLADSSFSTCPETSPQYPSLYPVFPLKDKSTFSLSLKIK